MNTSELITELQSNLLANGDHPVWIGRKDNAGFNIYGKIEDLMFLPAYDKLASPMLLLCDTEPENIL